MGGAASRGSRPVRVVAPADDSEIAITEVSTRTPSRRASLGSGGLRAEVAELRALTHRMADELAFLRGRVAQLSNQFRVAQYNILAGYLGDNRQPWFLYGVDVSEERRAAIMKKFYEKGPDGKFANAGWPKYVDGILSEEEQATITAYDDKYFVWESRKPALMKVIQGCDADLISLVECAATLTSPLFILC